ncbi:MAG: Flp pilus assembly complex ATPase component TadA [Deltaproteobacteria bacterium]|nr:Flp pilus assembly complex ATPase component TadA [Deltaproteobacteria bacterium]
MNPPRADQTAQFLGQVELFKTLRTDHLRKISEVMEMQTYQRDEGIARPGGVGQALYVIRTGLVGVHASDGETSRIEIARLATGDTFGETQALTNEKYSHFYKSIDRTAILAIDRAALREISMREPEVALGLLSQVASKHGRLDRERSTRLAELGRVASAGIDVPVPRHVLEKLKMIPLAKKGGVLTVACVDPSNLAGLDEIRRLVPDFLIDTVAIGEPEYQALLPRVSSQYARVEPSKKKPAVIDAVHWHVADDEKDKGVGPGGDEVKVLVDQFIAEGLERGASDIHIEPTAQGMDVRYRISGRLVKRLADPIPRAWARAVVSRIKVLAELDISERRRPQDGRVSLDAAGKPFDVRISTLPMRDGEKAVLRILDSSQALRPVEELILAEKVAKVVQKMISRPYGVMYVCGPTGSGKTTTLYSALGIVRGVHTNITTVEDPIEYNVPGITQVNVRPEIGLTFASILRSILRQDPNVILVGETRDTETARLVVEAGLTGHLVLTSLHTNDAVGTIQRMREMNIENFAIASSLIGILSQRLVRRLCPVCLKPGVVSARILEQLYSMEILPQGFDGELKVARGCESCDNTGFNGRVGIYELLMADDELRQRIMLNGTQFEIQATARKGTYVPLTAYGQYLLTAGVTTAEEILGKISGAAG